MAHSRSDSILILLALGAALSSVAVAAPLHPASVLTRRENHRDLGDNDLSSCPFDNHAAGAGCTTPDLSQLLPESLSSRKDNEPDDDVHHLFFPSSSGTLPLPTPVTAHAVVLEQRAGDAPPLSADELRALPDVKKILHELGPEQEWTSTNVIHHLRELRNWKADMEDADGDLNVFVRTTRSGQIYSGLVMEIRASMDRPSQFGDQSLWKDITQELWEVSPTTKRANDLWETLKSSHRGATALTVSGGNEQRFRQSAFYERTVKPLIQERFANEPKVREALDKLIDEALAEVAKRRQARAGPSTAGLSTAGSSTAGSSTAVANTHDVSASVKKIIVNLGTDKSQWTVDAVYSQLQQSASWKSDVFDHIYKDTDEFLETKTGKIYSSVVQEIKSLYPQFDDATLWKMMIGELVAFYRKTFPHLPTSPYSQEGTPGFLTRLAAGTQEEIEACQKWLDIICSRKGGQVSDLRFAKGDKEKFKTTTTGMKYSQARSQLSASGKATVAKALDRLVDANLQRYAE
ncbi:hypothetical protein EV360DRAFT_73285 [Lentinula raphanica]|nr:hypothetical protein EV360DRAFT_73285 [Lentinula raphanica]